jgi:hypothetical protein
MSNGRGAPHENGEDGDLPQSPVEAPRTRRARNGGGQKGARSAARTAAVPTMPAMPAGVPQRFVTPHPRPTPDPLVTLRVHVADRVLVDRDSRVEIGQPLLERCRETVIVDVPARPAWASLSPGEPLDAARLEAGSGSHGPRPGDRARLLFHGPDGRDRLVLGRHPGIVTSPVNGVVERIDAGAISIRADGLGLRADVGWGQPVHGPLLIAVSAPDAELRASAIDIGAAGAIVVAGARLDIEALTRARAIGAAGIICGGIVGRELRQLEESDRRQRAALHASAPFALIALDGYGRRPVPGPLWDLFVAAAGRPVGLVPEAHVCVIAGDPEPLVAAAFREPQTVRIAAGDGLGVEGRLVGLAGPVRLPGGLYAAGGFVDLPGPDEGPHRRVVPLADLERFG